MMLVSKNWMLALLLFFSLMLVAAIESASADVDRGHIHHNNGGDSAASADSVIDNVISDDSLGVALAFSYGMGDVDINEGQNCMGSEQKANILFGKQELALNAWCASLFYELNGKHTFAAKLRCEIPEVGTQYASTSDCIKDQDLSPITDNDTVTIYDEQRSQDESIEVVQMAQIDLVGRIEVLEDRPIEAPASVKFSSEQKAAVWDALDIKDDEE